MESLRTRMRRGPTLSAREIASETQAAIAGLEHEPDDRALAVAWRISAFAPWDEGRVTAAEAALKRALFHARRAGDSQTEELATNILLGAGILGPLPVPRAVARCEEVLSSAPEGTLLYADGCRALAWLRAMEGDFDEARELARGDRGILGDFGLSVSEAAAAEVYGTIEMLAGEPSAAETEFRRGLEQLHHLDEARMAPELAILLADALIDLQRHEEAAKLAEQVATSAEEMSSTGLRTKMVQARLAAFADDQPQAALLADEAICLARRTEWITWLADALLVKLDVSSREEREKLVREAHALYVRKGHIVGLQRAESLLAAVSRP
jgi:tetratricopeptide (TPR) repeat protein